MEIEKGENKLKTIKIGRKIHEIKSGDYILYNVACYQFCSGDKRTLKTSGWNRYTSLVIPKAKLKEIDFDNMEKVETGNKEDKNLLIVWYF